MNELSDEHLFKVIKEGGASVGKSPLMAPWGGTLTDDQIRDVVAFVRSIANAALQQISAGSARLALRVDLEHPVPAGLIGQHERAAARVGAVRLRAVHRVRD